MAEFRPMQQRLIGDEVADGDLPVDREPAADAEHDELEQKEGQARQARDEVGQEVGAGEPLEQFIEPQRKVARSPAFQAVGLDDALAGQVLLDIAGHAPFLAPELERGIQRARLDEARYQQADDDAAGRDRAHQRVQRRTSGSAWRQISIRPISAIGSARTMPFSIWLMSALKRAERSPTEELR